MKSQWHVRQGYLICGRDLSIRTLGWRSDEESRTKLVHTAADRCCWPVHEFETGLTRITYNPAENNRRAPVSEWLRMKEKTNHLLKTENATCLEDTEANVDRHRQRPRAMPEHPLL